MGKLNRRFTDWLYRWALVRYRKVFKQPLFNSPIPKVTEHAIVRYFERIEGRDIEALRNKLLSEELQVLIKAYGGEGKFIVDGIGFTVKNGKILSVNKPPSPLTPVVKPIDNQDIARKWSF